MGEDDERRRKPGPSDADELVHRNRSELRARDLEKMKLQDAELFGVDGKGGRFGAMEKTLMQHDDKIEKLETFRIRMLVYGSVLVAIGAFAAALLGKFLERVF